MSSESAAITMKQESTTALVPKLRFPEFRGEEKWSLKPGNSLFAQIKDRNPEPGLPVLAITQEHGAIPRHMIDYHVSVTEKSIESYKAVQVGDFIISLRSFQGGIEYSRYHGICSPAYVILRRRVKGSDEYFRHYLKTDGFIRDLTKNLEGLRDGKMISYAQFSELLLPIPSHDEQKRIADCLNSLDELIAVQARKVDALKSHKNGLMQQLFPREDETEPRLRFPEFQNAPAWNVKTLGRVTENLDNHRVPITSSDRKAGNIPYYGASGIVDYVEGYIFDENLLCVSEDGANLVARTYPIAFPISGKTWVNNHAHVLRFNSAYTQKFVELYLNSIKIDNFITGIAQPKLNKAMLDRIPIPQASDSEQERIASCLSSLDALITAETQKLAALKTHKKGLMQHLFPAPGMDET
jgi:type I restriction enzyme, S subunit